MQVAINQGYELFSTYSSSHRGLGWNTEMAAKGSAPIAAVVPLSSSAPTVSGVDGTHGLVIVSKREDETFQVSSSAFSLRPAGLRTAGSGGGAAAVDLKNATRLSSMAAPASGLTPIAAEAAGDQVAILWSPSRTSSSHAIVEFYSHNASGSPPLQPIDSARTVMVGDGIETSMDLSLARHGDSWILAHIGRSSKACGNASLSLAMSLWELPDGGLSEENPVSCIYNVSMFAQRVEHSVSSSHSILLQQQRVLSPALCVLRDDNGVADAAAVITVDERTNVDDEPESDQVRFDSRLTHPVHSGTHTTRSESRTRPLTVPFLLLQKRDGSRQARLRSRLSLTRTSLPLPISRRLRLARALRRRWRLLLRHKVPLLFLVLGLVAIARIATRTIPKPLLHSARKRSRQHLEFSSTR